MRAITIPAVSIAFLLLGAALADALPAGPGRVSATVDACHQSTELTGRYATFGAQMRAVSGTTQMSIRLELDERTPAEPQWRPVVGVPGFGVWKGSSPGVDIFAYSQEVTSLTAPATFRVTVAYRWIGSHHRVIKRARRMTPACSETLAPAGLVVGTLSRVRPQGMPE